VRRGGDAARRIATNFLIPDRIVLPDLVLRRWSMDDAEALLEIGYLSGQRRRPPRPRGDDGRTRRPADPGRVQGIVTSLISIFFLGLPSPAPLDSSDPASATWSMISSPEVTCPNTV
jgi:hypothetical protein